jgi:ABC-type lipoprotein release transport system permease subunit
MTSEFSMVKAIPSRESDVATIWGQVIDAVTGQPIEDATVTIWEVTMSRRQTYTTLKEVTKTTTNGHYSISVEDEFLCRVYAYYDNPTSPGYDYLPKLSTLNLKKGEEVNLLFDLVPAASIILEGALLFVDSPHPPETVSFSVSPEEKLPGTGGNILTYGTVPEALNHLIDENSSLIIVPANTVFNIKIEASTLVYHMFIVHNLTFTSLNKGEAIRIRVEQYSLPYNLNLTRESIRLAEIHIHETEQTGFYVQAERRDLEKIKILVDSVAEKLIGGFYKESYTDLREAYTKTISINEKAQYMYLDAATSVIIILIFLALTSTTLSFLIFQHWIRKGICAGLFYLLFCTIFYFVYAGCQIVDTFSFLIAAGLSISLSLLITVIIPRIFPMTILFSLAKQNIKRRILRFILTLLPITVLVMAFVTLTSFSNEYGFVSTTTGNMIQTSEGLLLREPINPTPSLYTNPPLDMVATFTPLETESIDWLQSQPEVRLVTPKLENWPSRKPLGSLSTSSTGLSIYGILGLAPSAEAKTTGFDKLLVQGRYLFDDENDSILLSVQAAKTLNVKLGDHLLLQMGVSPIEVTLVGLLDDEGLSQIKDLDGLLMIPEKLIIVMQNGIVVKASIDPCDPSEVLVTNWQTALKLFSAESPIFISRIDALVDDSVDLPLFSRQLALERDYWVWAATEEQITLFGLMSYIEAKGISIFIPWLIVILNVTIVMVNAIYERKHEVLIFSSIGLNPTHITSLFGAEAIITGIIGGGSGYILGLSLYKIITLLSINIDVRQKISALWSISSLGVSLSAVLVGTILALRFSIQITPSLLRRWRVKEKPNDRAQWIFELPIKVIQEEVDSTLEYIIKRLHEYTDKSDRWVGRIRQIKSERPTEILQAISFTYHKRSGLGTFLSRNQIRFSKEKDNKTLAIKLICDADEHQAYETARFVRSFFIEWSASKKGVVKNT